MSLSDLSEQEAVFKAIEEFDELGREAFLDKHGFGKAQSYFLLYQGARYDSKAIVGAAYGYQYPEHGSLRASEFSGGENTVARLLRELGFEVSTGDDEEREAQIWAFCANPKRYRIVDAVRQLEYDWWTIKKSDVRVGDEAVLWQTLDKDGRRGVVALGQVVEGPVVRPDDENPFWVDSSEGKEPLARVRIQYVDAPGLPIWVDESPDGEFLQSLNVARARGGTVFQVTEEQWERLLEIAGSTSFPSADETEVQELVRGHFGKKGGQGFGLNAKQRAAVEKRAMDLAIAYFSKDWDEVRDVSANSSYDLLCLRANEELLVEVKGTKTAGEKIILTKNEVKMGKEPNYTVFVVTEIELEEVTGEGPVASGGKCTVFRPWDAEKHVLEAITYTCTLDWSSGKRVRVEYWGLTR